MALNAKYEADFNSFYDAVNQANASLSAWEQAGVGVEQQMDKVNTSLSGVQDVDMSDVPANLKETTTEGKKIPPVLDSIAGSLGKAFSVGTVLAFVNTIIELGEEIKTTAANTGLATGEVQQLMYIASQTGAPIGALTGALLEMQERLGSDDRSGINGALTRLGINIQDFNAGSLSSQFVQVSAALKTVESDTEAAGLKAEIFGGKWKQIGPALVADLERISAEAPVATAAAVQGVDNVSSAYGRLWTAIKTGGLEAVGLVGGSTFYQPILELKAALDKVPPAWDLAARGFDAGALAAGELNTILKESDATLGPLIEKNKALNEIQMLLDTTGDQLKITLAGISEETRTLIERDLNLGASQQQVATAYGVTATQVKAVAVNLDLQSDALERQQELQRAVTDLWRESYAVQIEQTGTATDIAIADIERWATAAEEKAKEAGIATAEFYDALAALTHERMNNVLIDWDAIATGSQESYARNLTQIAEKAEATFQYAIGHSEQFSVATIQGFGAAAQAARDAADHWQESWVEASDVAVGAIEKTTAAAKTSFAEIASLGSKNAPGSVGVNLGEMSFGPGGLDAAMKAYTSRYSASSVGAIGGGPARDFLSFAKDMGYASPTVNNTFNIVDTEDGIARRVSEEIGRQIQRGSLVQ